MAQKQLHPLDVFLSELRKELEGKDLSQLKKILSYHRDWFGEEEDEYAWIETAGKQCIVDYILMTDPIMAEDGLDDFIRSLKAYGRY